MVWECGGKLCARVLGKLRCPVAGPQPGGSDGLRGCRLHERQSAFYRRSAGHARSHTERGLSRQASDAPRQTNRTDQSGRPLIFPGSESPPTPTPGSLDVSASVRRVADSGATSSPGGVEFNFDNADIPTVAKSLLGDVLELSYSVDPRVQGTVTLASAAPVARKDVLPVLESVLRMSNAAIVREGNLAKIIPLQDARERQRQRRTGPASGGSASIYLRGHHYPHGEPATDLALFAWDQSS